MRYLYKEYYNLKTIDERKSKANQRRRYDSTINFDLEIKPINQPEKFSLYYVPTNSTLKLAAEIARLDVILEMNYSKLPGLAQHNFFIDMLSRELFSTNELEGVKSSKEEIVRTTRSILGDSKKKPARFKNVIKSYLELKEGNLINLSPEAKRNYTKELLLPFKYGAVSMAKKTNSVIIPYSITGDYKLFSKNLKIVFGKPIDVSKLDIEKANEKLFNSIKKLLKENMDKEELKSKIMSEYRGVVNGKTKNS